MAGNLEGKHPADYRAQHQCDGELSDAGLWGLRLHCELATQPQATAMEGGKPSGGTVENPEFTVMDIQVGLASNNWEIMLNLDNAFDERYYTDVEPFPNFGFGGLIGTEPAEIIIGTHGHPRLFTASATYRF